GPAAGLLGEAGPALPVRQEPRQTGLPAERMLPLVQDHVMPALSGDPRSLEPARTAADDHDPLALLRRPERELPLAPRLGRAEAGDVELPRAPRRAPLVAADALDDLVEAPLARLVRPRRVRQEGTAESDQVDLAVPNRGVGVQRVREAADSDHGNRDRRL